MPIPTGGSTSVAVPRPDAQRGAAGCQRRAVLSFSRPRTVRANGQTEPVAKPRRPGQPNSGGARQIVITA